MLGRFVQSWTACAVAACLFGAVGAPRVVGSDVLAASGFDADPPFSQAPLLSEGAQDCSSTAAGVSQVEVHSGGHRYRLNDLGTDGESRGIALPLSESVNSGTLVVVAELIAAQSDREGGEICVSEEPADKWCMSGGFGADGKLRLHGQATSFAYQVGVTYRLRATMHLAPLVTTVDYEVVNLSNTAEVFTLNDQAVTGLPTAGWVTFRTGFEDDGSWAVDEIEVVRE